MALTQLRGSTQIQAGTVTNTQIAAPDASNPNGILLSKIQSGSLLVKSDGTVPFTSTIAGVTPVGSSDLATKSYVDGVASGLDMKASVRIASAGSNLSLTGLGAVDGVTPVAGDRVLAKDQTTPAQNGIYIAASGAWTRATDADQNAEVTSGMFTFVEEGTSNAGTGWVLSTANPITVGTTALSFAQFSQAGTIQAGAGLTQTGTSIDVISANGGIVVNADNLALTLADSTLSIVSGGVKLAPLTTGNILIGNGSSVATGVAVTGDVTISSSGVTAIGAGKVLNSMVAVGSIGLDKLVTAGGIAQLVLTNASSVPAYVALSGDATITAAGVLTLGAASVGTTKLVDASVTLAKLMTLTTGQLIIGTGAGNAQVALSGDATLAATGVLSVNPATVVRVTDVITRETPTGLVNGANVTYTLANTPKVGTESLFVNGILQEAGAGNDYTISGATITMLYTPAVGDRIKCNYLK